MNNYFIALFFFCLLAFAGCLDNEDTTSGCDTIDFLGVWNISEQCDSAATQTLLTITASTSGISIANIGGGGSGAVADAVVDGASFTIAPQTVQGYTIAGNGSLNAGCAQLTINWQGGANGSCAGTGTK